MPGWRSRPRSSTSLAHALAEVGSSKSRLVSAQKPTFRTRAVGGLRT